MADSAPPGLSLRAYLGLTRLVGLIAPWYLQRRLDKGREDPARWREKLGQTDVARPQGRLIWLNGVGVGEVMALRGVIEAMGRADPNTSFLVTSSARSSAEVIAANLPARTIHQYLPLDAPTFVARFLDHWQPDLAIWTEQEIWPGAIYAADRRGIPLAFLNARITVGSYEKRLTFKSLYADVLKRFQRIIAQDAQSVVHLEALGASEVRSMASVKSAAPELKADAAALAEMTAQFKGRSVWVAASTHPEDEAVVLAAQNLLFAADPKWLLVLVPRDPKRDLKPEMEFVRRSTAAVVGAAPIYLADTYGELGLWYRLARVAFMGGSFGPVEGHNPWEAAGLGCAVLHGPRVANFTADYAALHAAGAAREITDAETLFAAVTAPDLAEIGLRGQALVQSAAPLDDLAQDLLEMATHG